ncbi:hypothetical protein PN466_09000 [Roseofilum reptotaenium CS-1145]|uniref:Uncharacterized protein n=1 Tax=Roseofilum reptotaenium AO1-A TaxID=1925591 RepID=A0A1L9QNC7_9CYAN|nr:hypothetical protein [Roseofilum reptotaenium]MDB9517084.1 hypothetical protein [Roseofilum reptotaenium CS-1145]OJJ24170.1 hypothetical protein BI308_18050 [Roseofilum reptotaenium AO1-A]
MTQEFKITMLGDTQSGKTCFLLAMYEMMSFGIEGFVLSTDPDTDLDLSEKWNNIIDQAGTEERWPPPTGAGDFIRYDFSFNYGLTTPLIEFDWVDYRGGALRDRSSTDDTKRLLERLEVTDCVIICIPGDFFLKDGSVDRRKAQIVKRTNVLLEDSFKTRPIPTIIILITKSDLCSHLPREQIKSTIEQYFSVLFVKKHQGWVMLVPSTLGTELASDSNSGSIDPNGVHIPLIFTVFTYYKAGIDSMEEEIDAGQESLGESSSRLRAAENRNIVRRLWSRLSGDDQTARIRAEVTNRENRLNNMMREQQEAKQKLQLLFNQLNDYQSGHRPYYIYFDGEEV